MKSVKCYLVKIRNSKGFVDEKKFSFDFFQLEKNIFLYQDHAIMKPASEKSLPTPWHQDEAYWDPTLSYESLGVWVALQPVNVENGCMQFVPGSHKLDVLTHHTQDNNPRIHGLELDDTNQYVKNIAQCPLPAGGATFHHCRTIHYTGANHSSETRRAFTLQFQCGTHARETPRDNTWNDTKITEREKRAKLSGWNFRAP